MKSGCGFLAFLACTLVMFWVMGHSDPVNVLAATGLSLVGLALWWPLWKKYGRA